MKKLSVLLIFFLLPLSGRCDEGMWLINAFHRNIYPLMVKQGLKLQPGEIYNENSPALSDAIVMINRGGTGSVISDQGLVITNHHVASGDIHALSTPEKNYLEEGFWASGRSEEIPLKGTTVSFVRKIVDVTPEAKEVYEELRAKNRTRGLSGIIENRYKEMENTPYDLHLASFWNGELYLLFYMEEFTDVRLVGAPPVTIGAFGGEQDNWSWPQHKGDFALYRVYGGKDGKPAAYSPDNVPIKPVKVLNICTDGIKENDYAMVIGFPGSTDRYMSSFNVEEKRTIKNPVMVKAQRDVLDVMKKKMETDPDIRLTYSDKYFGLSNSADLHKWENICLERYRVAEIRAAEEAELRDWIERSPERKLAYGTLLDDLAKGYAARADAARESIYHIETWWRHCNMRIIANRFSILANGIKRRGLENIDNTDEELKILKGILAGRSEFKDIDADTEKEIFITLTKDFVANVPRETWGGALNEAYDRFDGDVAAMIEDAFARTFCTTPEKIDGFFAVPRTYDEIKSDPMVAISSSVDPSTFSQRINAVNERVGFDISARERDYARAVFAMRKDKGIAQYPNANFTMRITYGNVTPLQPCDGVKYDWYSTIDGYAEKYDPDDYEFRVDDRMRSLIAARDWGRWGENGRLHVNFLTNNDITGGNSGSPVLNANGNIIGLAFDGNRESMAGDLYFHPDFAKTVCVDIRFVMWVIEKYAGAGALIREMNLTGK